MNRLGIPEAELADVLGPDIATVHSHLACADEPEHPLTAKQLCRFRAVAAASPGHAHSLANSAGVCAGREFAFDMVRPGLGLYGTSPYPGVAMQPVASVQARVVQVRDVLAGETVGYGAAWRAERDSRIATLNIGYADGLPRASAPAQTWAAGGVPCPAIGRVSMDLTAVDVTDADVRDGEWLTQTLDLPALAAESGRSQYELLVSLGRRYERRWT
jgi:alanine racemase